VRPVVVLCLNPALDLEWRVDGLRLEEKNAVLAHTRWAGGKGVNVARWLRRLGARPHLVLPLGGPAGRELRLCLRRERLPARVVPLRDATRVNLLLTAPRGRQMRFNHAGPALSSAKLRRILRIVRRTLPRAALLILSGSLPPGAPTTTYARLIRLARRHGVRTLLDCDGAALGAAVKARPFLVKPNEQELARWHGARLRTEADVVRAARSLSRATGGWVLVSRGAKAALLINVARGVSLRCRPPRATARNRLGAGDAFLAGAASQIACDAPPAAWLQHALAAGTAATLCLPGALPRPALWARFYRAVRSAGPRPAGAPPR